MNEYEQQAKDFLDSTGTKMVIRKTGTVRGFPFEKNGTDLHDRYSVTLVRGDKKCRFPFYGSVFDYLHNKRPTPYDILACLQSYEVPDDMWEFAEEYGFKIRCKEDYERVKKCWRGCRQQYRDLCEMYEPELMEKLTDIV
jgi:hypothetical protein